MKPDLKASPRPASPSVTAVDGVLITLLTLSLYSLLMFRYPIIYGGDPVARIVNFPRILNGHQLPLLQVLIYFVMRWFYGPQSMFLLMALISSAACAGIHALTLELTGDRRAAWLASILYVTHPFILYYSRVPYQEPLLVAGAAWGFYYLFRPVSTSSLFLSSLGFGVACFSRYEGWIAALTAAMFRMWQSRCETGRLRSASVRGSLATFGWAPAAWILWNRGFSPAGTYVLDVYFRWSRFYRPYFILKSSLWWTESAVTLIAIAGLAYSLLDARERRDGRTATLLAFAASLLAALLFSGHGIEPDAERLVTEREAFVPISLLALYAGIGGSRLLGELERRPELNRVLSVGLPVAAVLLMAGYGVERGIKRIAAANADPDLKTDYEVAAFLAERNAGCLVFAPPLPAEPVQSYLRSVEKWSGIEGKEKAKLLLEEVETTPLDYQRVLMFSWMGRSKVFSGDQVRGLEGPEIGRFLREKGIRYLVVFSDFTPAADQERTLVEGVAERHAPEFEIRNGTRVARIYAAQSLWPLSGLWVQQTD